MERNRLLYEAAGTKAACSAKLAESANSRNPSVVQAPPDALAPFHRASRQERDRRVCDVLRAAAAIYRRGEKNLRESIDEADGSSQVVGEYAKRYLRLLVGDLNLDRWENDPLRLRRDVHRLLRRAIGRLAPHGGGWFVAVGSKS